MHFSSNWIDFCGFVWCVDNGQGEKHNIFVSNRQEGHDNCFALSFFPPTETKMLTDCKSAEPAAAASPEGHPQPLRSHCLTTAVLRATSCQSHGCKGSSTTADCTHNSLIRNFCGTMQNWHMPNRTRSNWAFQRKVYSFCYLFIAKKGHDQEMGWEKFNFKMVRTADLQHDTTASTTMS